MIRQLHIAAVLLLLVLLQDTFAQPMVSTNKTIYDIGESIIVTFSGGPKNATDWIGIYKEGDVPGNEQSTLWNYVNGSQSPDSGRSDGTVTFTEGLLNKGSYWAGFFENDGYTILDSVSFSVANLSDSTAPLAPVVSVVPGSYYNTITWTDVPGENNETYSVYVSVNSITDVNADGVDLIGINITEGAEMFEHVLRSANTDRERTYYYAVVCRDLAGNSGSPGSTSAPAVNTAKGVPTISVYPPSPFAADGDASEWAEISPFIMQSALGTANVPANNVVQGDADLSAEARIAIDNDYLYVMMDITDDIYTHPLDIDPWERDEPDLYIGFYNLTDAHIEYGEGKTPDYQIRFDEDRIRLDANTDDSLFIEVGENYYHAQKFPSGYMFEARIPLADLETKRQDGQTANDTIEWKAGDRIPFTIGINDNDDTPYREGMIFYSPQPVERAYFDVSSWTYTWISDEVTDVENKPSVITTYELKQNYPNPFNPVTQIHYSIAEPGYVSLKVFDITGRQVDELVNKYQNAGSYTIDFSTVKNNIASGVYIYQLQSGGFFNAKKMTLLK